MERLYNMLLCKELYSLCLRRVTILWLIVFPVLFLFSYYIKGFHSLYKIKTFKLPSTNCVGVCCLVLFPLISQCALFYRSNASIVDMSLVSMFTLVSTFNIFKKLCFFCHVCSKFFLLLITDFNDHNNFLLYLSISITIRLTQYLYDNVILTFIRRRPNVMDVETKCAQTGFVLR